MSQPTDSSTELRNLIEQVTASNWTLLSLASKLSPKDQLIYIPKIRKLIEEQNNLLKTPENDIPGNLFQSPKAN